MACSIELLKGEMLQESHFGPMVGESAIELQQLCLQRKPAQIDRFNLLEGPTGLFLAHVGFGGTQPAFLDSGKSSTRTRFQSFCSHAETGKLTLVGPRRMAIATD